MAITAARRDANSIRSRGEFVVAFSAAEHDHLASAVDGVSSSELCLIEQAQTSSVATGPDVSVAFDGRLFNRRDLEAEVGASDSASASDAQLTADLVRRNGADALWRLRGAFAVVAWDARTGDLYCVRDPLGVHPLFVAERPGGLVAGTNPDALVACPGVSAELDRIVLTDHLLHRWPDPTETFYAAVRRVPPGHAFQLNRTGTRLFRHWNPGSTTDVDWVDADEVDRFDDLLEQAVRRPLDGRCALYLSSGLDSVTVAAVAADLSAHEGRPAPWGFSLVFPGNANEEEGQRAVAASLGLPHLLVPLAEAAGPRGLLVSGLELSAAGPAPKMNLWTPAYDHLSAAARARGCTVVLTGGGGDEWLGVSPFLAADFLRSGNLVGLYRLWSTLRNSYTLSHRLALRNVLWTFGAKAIIRSTAERIAEPAMMRRRLERATERMPTWAVPDADLRRESLGRIEATGFARRDGSFYLHEGALSLDHTLVAMEKEEFFEDGRRNGLPIYMPFWDADLVEFLYRIPPRILTRGNRTKGLVREMLARRFPTLGFDRHRKVLSISVFQDVIEAEGSRAWEWMDGTPALADLRLVDQRSFHERLQSIVRGERPGYAYEVWEVLALEAWVRARL